MSPSVRWDRGTIETITPPTESQRERMNYRTVIRQRLRHPGRGDYRGWVLPRLSRPAAGIEVTAPFVGAVRFLVEEGDVVETGEPLATVEAMKMEAVVTAPRAGRVRRLLVADFRTVQGGQALLVLD